MNTKDFYNFERNGVIKSRVAGTRVFFFSAKSWMKIEDELFRTFSTGAAVMLSEMGKSYGRYVAREAKLVEKEPSAALTMLQRLAGASGWGEVSISGDLARGENMEITFRECIFCAERSPANGRSCHFLAGLAAGIADELYGSTHVAKESSCLRGGGKACVFSIGTA